MSPDAGHGRALERQAVTRAVDRLIDQARHGSGRALLVIGGSGLGKSTVVAQACVVAGVDMRVAIGRADRMESSLPFGVIAQVFDALGGREVLEVEAAGRAPRDVRAEAFRRAGRWLETTAVSPVLLAFDDLHWSDAESLALLSFLIRRIGNLPVAVVGTLRPWPADATDVCLGLSSAGHATVEQLLPLSEIATTTLLMDGVGRPLDGNTTSQAWRLTAGNPVLLEQLVRGLAQGQTLPETTTNLTGIANQMLLARFSGLPATAVRCAQGGSVLGSSFNLRVAASIARLDEGEAQLAIEALTRSGLVRDQDDTRVEFVHPLFRQALHDDLAGPLRSMLHARAFHALSERGMEAQAAEHAIRGDLHGDTNAIAILRSRGRTALDSGAPTTAAQRLGEAVELAGDRADADLLLGYGEALVAAGRPEAAAGVCERALQLALAPMMRVEALRMLARALSLGHEHEASCRRFEEAAATAEMEDAALAVEVLLDYALTTWYTRGPKVSYPPVVRARELAGRLDQATQQRAAATQAYIALELGDASGWNAIAGAAAPVLADPLSDVRDLYFPWGRLSMYAAASTLLERLDEADRAHRILLTAAERVGSLTTISTVICQYGWALLHMGRLGEALACGDRSLGLAGLVPFVEPIAAAGRAYVLLLMGRLDECAAACLRVAATAPPQLGQAQIPLMHTRAYRSYCEGRVTEASDTFLNIELHVAQMGLREPCEFAFARHAIAAHISCGRITEARRTLDWLEACSSGLPCRYPRIAAATGTALLAEHAGDQSAAHLAHRRALALHKGVDLPIEMVETLMAYGTFLRRQGQPAAARPLLAEAVEIAERVGAHWLAGRGRDELNVAGGRRRPVREAPDALTSQEDRVARLTAKGRSNREIAQQLSLSVKTVETHLQRIYRKLGIHSRRDLMQMPLASDSSQSARDREQLR